MNAFEFYNPVRVVFEPGSVSKVGEKASAFGKRVLLVSYREHDFLRSVLERISESLSAAALEVSVFFDVSPNPTIKEVERGVALAKKERVDLVIGVGGGSVMDAAKAMAAGVFYEGELWNMVASSHKSGNETKFPNKALPTMMVPTMAATGSEMNCCAVLSNEDTREKSYVWDDCLYPKVALVDPELTCSLPAYQTACGAADIFSHALEFYLNGLEDTPVNYPIQEGVMKTVLLRTESVLADPQNLQGRSDLQWASIVALNGIAQPGNAWTPMHQIGHVLSARYGVPHGASLALVMPAWMKRMWATREDRYLEFALNVMGVEERSSREETVLAGIDAFEKFLHRIGVGTSLAEAGVPEAELEAVAEDVRRISFNDEDVLPSHSPVNFMMVRDILSLAYSKSKKVKFF